MRFICLSLSFFRYFWLVKGSAWCIGMYDNGYSETVIGCNLMQARRLIVTYPVVNMHFGNNILLI